MLTRPPRLSPHNPPPNLDEVELPHNPQSSAPLEVLMALEALPEDTVDTSKTGLKIAQHLASYAILAGGIWLFSKMVNGRRDCEQC